MNAHDPEFAGNDLARLHYGDGDFAVLKPGRFVICAVSGKKIPLEQLRYWSAARRPTPPPPRRPSAGWRPKAGSWAPHVAHAP